MALTLVLVAPTPAPAPQGGGEPDCIIGACGSIAPLPLAGRGWGWGPRAPDLRSFEPTVQWEHPHR